MMKQKLAVLVVTSATLAMSQGVYGQDVLSDLLRERVDEHRLRHDYRVLHRDMAHGNTAAVQSDMMRIQQDQAILARDQSQLNYDLYGRPNPTAPSPYANYPGYYPSGGPTFPVPSQSAPPMLLPVPQPTLSLAPQPIPQMMMPPLNPLPSATLIPPNPIPGTSQTVSISNPVATGATLSYVFGDRAYSLDPGRTQEFAVTSPTIVVFNRGGQAGVARYTLSGGNTFEFRADSSGWLLIQKRPELAAMPQDAIPPSPSLSTSPAPAPDPAMTSLPPLSTTIP